MYGAGDSKGAIAAIDRLAGPDWYAIFKDLHAGMILDLAGNKKEAGKRFEHAYKLDATALRVVEAYGSWLSRNASSKEALDGVRDLRQGAAAPSAGGRGDRTSSRPARNCRCWSSNAQAGAAEALYGLGASLGRRGGEDLGLVYLQLVALSRAQPSAGAALARRSLRVAEEAGTGDQGL